MDEVSSNWSYKAPCSFDNTATVWAVEKVSRNSVVTRITKTSGEPWCQDWSPEETLSFVKWGRFVVIVNLSDRSLLKLKSPWSKTKADRRNPWTPTRKLMIQLFSEKWFLIHRQCHFVSSKLKALEQGLVWNRIFIFFHTHCTTSFRRKCWVSSWWSVVCAGDAGPGGAGGTWSWSPGKEDKGNYVREINTNSAWTVKFSWDLMLPVSKPPDLKT